MDIKELYNKTRIGTFIVALSILGDRALAREAAVEAYKRAAQLAYKFDENMSAEYWVTDMVKNLATNGLRDANIGLKAQTQLQDNISLITKYALFESEQDRGEIIAAKLATNLTLNEVSDLLWYNKYSLKGEYERCLKEAGEKNEIKDAAETERIIKEDFEKITPEYYDFVENEEYETAFANISEQYENVRTFNKKKFVILLVAIFVVLIAAALALTVYFVKKRKSELKTESIYSINEPEIGASEAMIEYNGKLYYENRKDGATLYCYDKSTGKAEKLGDQKPKDFMIYGTRVYFRNSQTGHLSYINTENNEVTESEVLGSIPAVYGDRIVYSVRTGVALCDADLSKENEQIIFTDATVYKEKIVTYGKEIYISSGASMGIIRLTEQESGEFAQDITLDSLEFYDIKVTDGLIIFEDGLSNIILINVSNPKANTKTTLPDVLYSAAFCIDNDNIYYYGKDGIYCVSIDDALEENVGELVVDLKDREHTVSDLYVSGENIYCYFSNGEKDDPYNELTIYSKGQSLNDGVNIFKVGK